MYYIFSFRSRSQSISFFDKITKKGYNVKLINTPRVVSVGCGLSVKINANCIDEIILLFDKDSFDTFLGLFYFNGSEISRITVQYLDTENLAGQALRPTPSACVPQQDCVGINFCQCRINACKKWFLLIEKNYYKEQTL